MIDSDLHLDFSEFKSNKKGTQILIFEKTSL